MASKEGTGDKLKGNLKDATGQAREKVGDATGNQEMKAKGQNQQAEGKVDKLKGGAKDKIASVKDKLT